ncbi:MAG TPA: hypothetical protein VM263_04840, partial [Acidimicrobiales bacterium]|nr:hypothetical protein [Acidimicrobiales bacterium]
MLLEPGRHSRRRGARRRRAEAAADAAAARLFPITVAGYDDGWDVPAPAEDGVVPWWLDVDDDAAEQPSPALAGAAAGGPGRRPERAGVDRYSTAYDLLPPPPDPAADKEVDGPAANQAGMPAGPPVVGPGGADDRWAGEHPPDPAGGAGDAGRGGDA